MLPLEDHHTDGLQFYSGKNYSDNGKVFLPTSKLIALVNKREKLFNNLCCKGIESGVQDKDNKWNNKYKTKI